MSISSLIWRIDSETPIISGCGKLFRATVRIDVLPNNVSTLSLHWGYQPASVAQAAAMCIPSTQYALWSCLCHQQCITASGFVKRCFSNFQRPPGKNSRYPPDGRHCIFRVNHPLANRYASRRPCGHRLPCTAPGESPLPLLDTRRHRRLYCRLCGYAGN